MQLITFDSAYSNACQYVEQIDFIKEMQPELPLHSDLMEVTAAMHRVQQTYEMEPADMSKGLLDGVQLKWVIKHKVGEMLMYSFQLTVRVFRSSTAMRWALCSFGRLSLKMRPNGCERPDSCGISRSPTFMCY